MDTLSNIFKHIVLTFILMLTLINFMLEFLIENSTIVTHILISFSFLAAFFPIFILTKKFEKMHNEVIGKVENLRENIFIEDISIINDLKKAIKNKEFELFFHPKKDLSSEKITSVECLIRWNHPEKGVISPNQFIRVAENTDLIQPITEWVIKETLRSYKRFKKEKIDLSVSFNVSAKCLQHSFVLKNVAEYIKTYDVDPTDLIMEITETSIMTNSKMAIDMLSFLKEMGIIISIDDFGTGHSSFLYLRSLPAAELKIDKSFINNICISDQDKKIVKSTIDLAHSINFSVVAEGVEDEETEIILKEMGCDEIQGYILTKPLPFKEFINWIKAHQ